MATIESAIESFHEAAIMPDRWPVALDVLSQTFKARGITLVLKSTSLHSIAVSTSVQPFVADYLSGRITDSREERVHPTVLEGFMPDQAYFSKSEIRSDPYYQEFLAPRDLGWNAVAMLHGQLHISFKRSFADLPYDGADLMMLNALLPGLRSASRTARLTWNSEFKGQLSAFERLHRGAVLIDRDARILEANACTSLGDGLDTSGGALLATHPASRAPFQRFLSTILRGASGCSNSPSAALSVQRPSGRRPWVLDGIACTDAVRSLHSRAAALIIVTDLDRPPRSILPLMRDLFGLTGKEAKLANELMGGIALRAAAERLAISEGHARQRLQSIFSKTHTSRQGELIALLSKL